MKSESSKIIKINRALGFTHEANAELTEWFGQAARGIGSYFRRGAKKAGTGLSFQEEELLMPGIVNLPHTDRDFRKAVDMFFIEITTKVPADGLILEIGLIDNAKPLGAKLENEIINMPLELEDYVRYRHAISHPQVAASEFEAEGNQLVLFYIKDSAFTSTKRKEENDIKDKAMAIYLTVKNDPKKVERILTNIGIDTKPIGESDQVLKLKSIAEGVQGGLDVVKNFIDVAEDKDLETKWRINKLVQAKVLTKVGSRIIITESGKEIGRDMKESVLYWSDETNSEEVGLLIARYKELAVKS